VAWPERPYLMAGHTPLTLVKAGRVAAPRFRVAPDSDEEDFEVSPP
jgi:hypothetical protein